MKERMKNYFVKKDVVFQSVLILLLLVFCFTTIYPFIYLLSLSLTPTDVSTTVLRFFTPRLDFSNYRQVFQSENLLRGFYNTLVRVVLGTSVQLLAILCCAYALSKKYFPHRSFWTGFIVFTMYFSGGLIPSYLLIKHLHLFNTVWVYILPALIPTFTMMIVRNFFMGIPETLEESARIDGASEFTVLFRIVLPISMPIIATVILWQVVGHWNAWFDCLIEDDGDLLTRWNEEFDVTITMMNFDPQSMQEQLNLKIAGGEIPDVFFVTTTTLSNYYKQGALAEIPDEVIETYMPLCLAELEAEAPGIMDYGYMDGKRYGMPRSIFYYYDYHAPIVYNGLWMKKLGVESAPATFEEFEALMYRFANEDPDGNGQKDTYGLSNTGLNAVYGAFGVQPGFWMEKDGEIVPCVAQPEMREALTVLSKWYADKVLDPEYITGENTGGYWALSQAFIQQKIGLTNIGAFYHWSPELPGRAEGANYTELKKTTPELAENIVFGDPIKTPEGKGGIQKSSVIQDSYLVFGSHLEKEKDKIGKILEITDTLMGSVDNYLSAFYGVKDQDWTIAEDGSIKMQVEGNDLIARGAWGTMQFVALGRNNFYPEQALVDWAKENKLDQGGFVTALPDLVELPSKAKYMTDLNKLQDTMIVSIITGDKPIEYFDTFVEEWRSMGGEEVVKEANEWYKVQ